jgi:hypothetical protein
MVILLGFVTVKEVLRNAYGILVTKLEESRTLR